MKKSQIFLSTIGLCVSLAVHSANTGWYAGLGLVNSSFDAGVSDWDDGSLVSGSVDDSDSGLTFYFGNRISDNLAVEFGHIDLGETTFKGVTNGGLIWNSGNVAADIELSGIQISALGIAPISDSMEFYVKAGMFMWEADLSISNTILGSGSGSEDDNDLYIGVGFQYNFKNQGSLRVAWEDYGDFDLELDTTALIVSYSVNL